MKRQSPPPSGNPTGFTNDFFGFNSNDLDASTPHSGDSEAVPGGSIVGAGVPGFQPDNASSSVSNKSSNQGRLRRELYAARIKIAGLEAAAAGIADHDEAIEAGISDLDEGELRAELASAQAIVTKIQAALGEHNVQDWCGIFKSCWGADDGEDDGEDDGVGGEGDDENSDASFSV